MKAIIIDDEAVALAAMQRRIHWEKYGIDEVFTAQSMRQAIRVMEENPMDLMLCDVEMPGGSGLELYEWVRTYCPDTECVFVSCHPEYEYVRKALTMGSMDYVLKPVDYEEMDRILQEAAERIKKRYARAQGIESSNRSLRNNALPENEEPESAPASDRILSDTIQGAVHYIREHLGTNMSIGEIALAVHLNPQYFMRLFKKETGKSVLEYITDCRLSSARQMLEETNLPITEVALAAGYDNFSYFSKLFRRNEGMSPSEYRKGKRQ